MLDELRNIQSELKNAKTLLPKPVSKQLYSPKIKDQLSLSTAAVATTESAVSTIEDLLGAFVRSIYTRSSVSTHTATSKGEVLRIRDLVRVALCELLEIPT